MLYTRWTSGRKAKVWPSGSTLCWPSVHTLPAYGPLEAYERIFQCALAHIPVSARYMHVVFGDINQNPR